MKRVLVAIAVIMVASACTTEDILLSRAERLAANETKQILYVPDSYEPIETTIDSAFMSKYTDPAILSAVVEIIEIKENGGLISMFRSADKVKERAKFICERIDSIKDGEFLGWTIHHRYRAKNRIGHPDIAEIVIFTDNIISESIATFSLDATDRYSYQRVTSLIEQITEVDEFRQDISSAVSTFIEEMESIDYEETTSSWEEDIEIWTAETESQVESFVEEFEAESATIIEGIEQISSKAVERASTVGKKITTTIEEESYFDDFGESSNNEISIDSDTMIELNNL